MNIYKAAGANPGGGGQTYIDTRISSEDWQRFLRGIPPEVAVGAPKWRVPVHSLGSQGLQIVTISERRAAGISIRNQAIHSAERIFAWRPDHGRFPAPSRLLKTALDPEIPDLIADLRIFMVRTTDGTFWAGWFKRGAPPVDRPCPVGLDRMFDLKEGYFRIQPAVPIDESDIEWPFRTAADGPPAPEQPPPASIEGRPETLSEEGLLERLFGEDADVPGTPAEREQIRRVKKRNVAAARRLKALYRTCQLTGSRFVFKKVDGLPYLEAHHLLPLGKGGADHTHNLIVVSGHIHKMLHHAHVEGLDFSKIRKGRLRVKINGKPFTIRWHPRHAALVERALRPGS